MANEKITEYVSSVTALENGDLIDVSKDTAGTGLVWESQKMTQTVLRTTLGVNATARYIPVYDGTKIVPSTIYQSAGGNYGVFGVTTPTYSWSFDGDSTRSIGVERRSGSSAGGVPLGLVGGGAAVGSSNQDAGGVNFSTGTSTGNGTGKFTWSAPAANQGSGTTDRTPTAKMFLLGKGWLGFGGGGTEPTSEFEMVSSTANVKARMGASLDTICGVVQHNGLYLATPDGVYDYPISMSVGTDYRAYFGGGNNGFMFVKNPQSDSHPLVAMGTSVTNISAGCEGSYNYRYQFARVWNNGGNSTSMYVNTSGTNSIAANAGLLELVNTVTNVNGSNYGLQISVTGSSTGTNQNVAISTTNGKVVFYGAKGDYDVSFGATANRTFGVNRETVAAVGRKLSIYGGSACAGNTDLTGGNVEIITGIATGTGSADIIFQTTTAGATGTTDRTPTTKMTIKGLGNVGIGITNPNACALLDLTSTTQGLLVPRLTTTQIGAIGSPVAGLICYDITTNKAVCYNGTIWNDLY